MITCDLLQEPPSLERLPEYSPEYLFGEKYEPRLRTLPRRLDSRHGEVLYRQPLAARMTTWRLTTVGEKKAWKEERSDWILVTHPADTRTVKLPLEAEEDTALTYSFADSGALKEITSNVTGGAAARVDAIAALPSKLKDAATAGSGFGAAISPAAARAAALKQRLEEAETRKKLQGILDPVDDPFDQAKHGMHRSEGAGLVCAEGELAASMPLTVPTSSKSVAASSSCDWASVRMCTSSPAVD